MRLWRLSGARHARACDGGYGRLYDGRWNRAGRAITYAATSPALCVLEKLVHVEDPTLLPALVMVTYRMPDALGAQTIALAGLPDDWRRQEGLTQRLGEDWHRARATALLIVPSALVPLAGSPDVNVVINHDHPAAARIEIEAAEPFVLDPRLF